MLPNTSSKQGLEDIVIEPNFGSNLSEPRQGSCAPLLPAFIHQYFVNIMINSHILFNAYFPRQQKVKHLLPYGCRRSLPERCRV